MHPAGQPIQVYWDRSWGLDPQGLTAGGSGFPTRQLGHFCYD
jgi:hypothetical protein